MKRKDLTKALEHICYSFFNLEFPLKKQLQQNIDTRK